MKKSGWKFDWKDELDGFQDEENISSGLYTTDSGVI